MLYHYLDHKRKESSAQLHATYLVSGKFVDNGQTVRRTTNEQDVFWRGLHVSVHVDSPLMLRFFSESQGVRCQRGPVGRCVNVFPRLPAFTL